MELNSDAVKRGRKKVFAATQKLELLLPPNKNDGHLDEGDLIYVVKRMQIEGKDVYRFKVIKFAETKREGTVYTSETKYFKPQYTEQQANADGDKDDTDKDKSTTDNKVGLTVPIITALGVGAFGFFLAKKQGRNPIWFTGGGLIAGAVIGIMLCKMKK